MDKYPSFSHYPLRTRIIGGAVVFVFGIFLSVVDSLDLLSLIVITIGVVVGIAVYFLRTHRRKGNACPRRTWHYRR